MKKRLALILILTGVLSTGFSQVIIGPGACFEQCLMDYRDCQEIYGSQICWPQFDGCLDQCER